MQCVQASSKTGDAVNKTQVFPEIMEFRLQMEKQVINTQESNNMAYLLVITYGENKSVEWG